MAKKKKQACQGDRPISIIFKSNALINEARYKLTLSEQKFIIFAISKIKKDDQNKEYTFSVDEFARTLNLGARNAYRDLRRIVKSLMNRSLSFCPDEETEVFIHWFEKVVYKRYKATISFTFSDDLTSHLFNLKEKFTAYKLQSVLRLNSVYSIRLYELLKQSEWIGGREINLDELKELLGIPTIYPLYNDFKRNVLEVARKELSSKSDISFTYKEIKRGKKVAAFFLKGVTKRKRGIR